jgi:hypothetical protein
VTGDHAQAAKAPRLKAGRNVLAAVVWNAGIDGPVAQATYRTAFLLAGPKDVETGGQWKCIRDEAYSPESVRRKVYGPDRRTHRASRTIKPSFRD